MDEKARLFISYWCRLYGLRIPETLFETISSFHGMQYMIRNICTLSLTLSFQIETNKSNTI